jgi:nitrate reductase assembly molybdenum cofactor insertion protein NarJ
MTATAHEPTIGVALGRLLAYPLEDFPRDLDAALEATGRFSPEAAAPLEAFAAAVRPLTPDEREELFTRTFDINPIGALEIGWHLFGEDYHRGALLVRLRTELRRHGIEEAGELPDHLTRVLALLDCMEADEAGEFARACVLPALDKMLAGFQGKENPYERLLHSATVVLVQRFGRDSEACQRLDEEPTAAARMSLPVIYEQV